MNIDSKDQKVMPTDYDRKSDATEPRIRLFRKELVYVQEPDSCDSAQLDQTLYISTDDAGGGSYVILKTDRWALDRDDIDGLCQQLKDALEGLE